VRGRVSRASARWLLGAVVAAWAASALAQADIPDGKWWKRPRLAAEINLTPQQSREIETIFVRTRPRLIDLKADLEKKQLALQVSMEDKDKPVDRRNVEREIEAVENARSELQKTRALMILDMRQVLRPEQWERLLQMQQTARERRQMMRERMEERMAEPDSPRRNIARPSQDASPSPEKPKPSPEKKNQAD
jgi:Spy/CpxP family protein refolding chaperone